ncbi:arylesterase [Sphingobium phenoxybenzoativorans]|uniref:arylesterase n=1 Tax=Sphingobium phenoxybenzoativorans TaxID=1592790 RepID=UPI00209AEC70|nr:arylesterase [Sphingobium phenoxybenzoativorans]
MLTAAAPAHAADKVILAFGDSLTAGYGLKPAEAFPAQLEAALRRDKIAVRVQNAGVSGDTTAQARARLDWVLRSMKQKPDLVIVQLGGNDMLRGIDPAQTRANLSAILAELKKRKMPVLLAGMLAAPNLGSDYARKFNPIYPALAKQYGAALYPFFLRGVTGNPKLLLKDNMHPTGPGVAVVVRGIAPSVKKALGQAGIQR